MTRSTVHPPLNGRVLESSEPAKPSGQVTRKPKFDRIKYQKEYMKRWRAKRTAELHRLREQIKTLEGK